MALQAIWLRFGNIIKIKIEKLIFVEEIALDSLLCSFADILFYISVDCWLHHRILILLFQYTFFQFFSTHRFLELLERFAFSKSKLSSLKFDLFYFLPSLLLKESLFFVDEWP